jgi:hypothetical protein
LNGFLFLYEYAENPSIKSNFSFNKVIGTFFKFSSNLLMYLFLVFVGIFFNISLEAKLLFTSPLLLYK